jgi:hypothetical protein
MLQASLPVTIWQLGYHFPWPLVWEISVDWSFSVDAELVERGVDYTDTSTITGSGSGSVVIGLDPLRAPTTAPSVSAEGKFLLTKRLTSSNAVLNELRLFGSSFATAGSFSVAETLETDFDDPEEENLIDEITTAADNVAVGLDITIGPETVTVNNASASVSSGVSTGWGWIPANSWTFSRANLFVPQTQTLTRTPEELTYETGPGWTQTITLELTAYTDRPL